ncbi:MAG: hypothetical protein P4L44_01345 [Oryzomonas sp.]|uniref:hypothetical protein n=1 Tax=Oryzomonas sp. TaxID=2855186 RepID=UPI0028466C22|nr:hypothetical protein [Oryzomonas sp.]MDR3578587.1 hypothetical protein [Oryzomonas sp.]
MSESDFGFIVLLVYFKSNFHGFHSHLPSAKSKQLSKTNQTTFLPGITSVNLIFQQRTSLERYANPSPGLPMPLQGSYHGMLTKMWYS